tara:strand:+ start:164 stop:301 length:138 start_codon:yes stop_codon:yes gene_type:complete
MEVQVEVEELVHMLAVLERLIKVMMVEQVQVDVEMEVAVEAVLPQ